MSWFSSIDEVTGILSLADFPEGRGNVGYKSALQTKRRFR
jgi:hypothetical protein